MYLEPDKSPRSVPSPTYRISRHPVSRHPPGWGRRGEIDDLFVRDEETAEQADVPNTVIRFHFLLRQLSLTLLTRRFVADVGRRVNERNGVCWDLATPHRGGSPEAPPC